MDILKDVRFWNGIIRDSGIKKNWKRYGENSIIIDNGVRSVMVSFVFPYVLEVHDTTPLTCVVAVEGKFTFRFSFNSYQLNIIHHFGEYYEDDPQFIKFHHEFATDHMCFLPEFETAHMETDLSDEDLEEAIMLMRLSL